MLEVIRKVVTNVLIALYQPFSFAVLLTILFMFLYLFAKEHGLKTVVRRWIEAFKHDRKFRKILLFVFYTVMILFRTLINRNMWENPVSNVIGVWGLYNEQGKLTTEVIENLALFIPFTILLFWCFKNKILEKKVRFLPTVGKSIFLVFLFSLSIEFLQLFLRLGTFQLSDLFYNTLGGFVGGFLYWIGHKITSRKMKWC